MRRRSVLTAAALAVPAAAVGTAGVATPALAHGRGQNLPPTTVTPIAVKKAARTDRRPVAGGVYDARARKTYVSWGGQFEDNYVQEFDHRAAKWSEPVRVGDGGNDSHNYPTVVLADDGHILVFRGMHNEELWFARSPRPHSVAGTWTDTLIPEGLGATYPMPFKAANGDIFVFIRETAGDFDPAFPGDTRPMKYVRSTDDGKTWKSSQQLTGERWAIAPLDRTDNMNEIYIGQLRLEPATRNHQERVSIVYTLAGGGPEGHLHDRYHRNIYHVYFSPRTLRFSAADGRDLGTRIDDADQEKYLKVVETPLQMPNPRSPDYINLAGTTVDGSLPFVLWMQLDAATAAISTWASVYVPGTGWSPARSIGTGFRVRDMEEVDEYTWRVYTTPTGTPAAANIGTYLLSLGTHLRLESTIATPQPIQRIEVVGDARDDVRILLTGTSSAREVEIADGDVYVVGR